MKFKITQIVPRGTGATQTPPVAGWGDLVHKVAAPIARVLRLEDCGGGCEERRQWLNKHLPLKPKID